MKAFALALLLACSSCTKTTCTEAEAAAIAARYAPRIHTECRKTGPCPPKDEANAEIARLCP